MPRGPGVEIERQRGLLEHMNRLQSESNGHSDKSWYRIHKKKL
jgi:hypothetical protein